jgi:hypothetical protein
MKFGQQAVPSLDPVLASRAPTNLNPAFWTGPGFSGGG